MKTTGLRALIRQYGDLGYALAGGYLLLHYLLVRQRVRTLTILFTLLAITGWAAHRIWHTPRIGYDHRVSQAPAAYTLTDLGTLRGAQFCVPYAVNTAGQVVGAAQMQDRSVHSFLWQNGKMRDLGGLGGKFCVARGINDSGQIVGGAQTKGEWVHAFVWQNGKMHDLSPGAEDLNFAAGINSRGEIVGLAEADAGLRAVIWRDGMMKEVGLLPGDRGSMAAAINNKGEVAGNSTSDFENWRPFIYQNDSLHPVPMPGPSGAVMAINDAGQSVGWYLRHTGMYTANATALFPSIIQNTGMTLTPVGAGREDWVLPVYMRLKGSDVGGRFNGPAIDPMSNFTDAHGHAYLSQNGKAIDLGTLGGEDSMATAVGDAGQVIGLSSTAQGETHAFLWQQGKIIDLNKLLPERSGWILLAAFGINRRGQIVGIGIRNRQIHAFLLTPGG